MFVNWKKREVNLKIVYYGPPLSGKTANLQWIHANTRPEIRGELVSLKAREGRTPFFDFMQMELDMVRGLKPKFNLYTVAGQVYYVASRKLVMQGADGVVFVADSQASRMRENVESMQGLRHLLSEMGHNPNTFPIVVQYNKRDLATALPPSLMGKYLARNGTPQFESIAIHGEGILDTLKAIVNLVIKQVQYQIQREGFEVKLCC